MKNHDCELVRIIKKYTVIDFNVMVCRRTYNIYIYIGIIGHNSSKY